ncbi:MAG: MCE family protein [Deltaproteobacteria bacterium]|nr:MCE family protein [Deltaproteobacteria bacterium]
MKHVSAGIKIGILVLVAAITGYYTWKAVGEQASGEGGYRLTARFRDATGLASKSRVVIAGLPIGEITERELEGRLAKITVRVRKGTQIWSNAGIYKKSSSLLGEYYLEIDPGTPEEFTDEGQPPRKNHLLKDKDAISNVYEATSADELMRRMGETLPRVDEVLGEIRSLAADARRLVNGPVTNMANNLDKNIEQDAKLVHNILERMDKVLATVDVIARDVRKVTGGDQVDRILDNVEEVSAQMKELIAATKTEVDQTGDKVREKLDRIDEALDDIRDAFASSASIAKKIDSDEGTLGRLVNDPQIADNVESITTDAASFVKTAFGLQTIVGIRSEYNFWSTLRKTYLSVELQPRPDKYYLVELVDDPRGAVTETIDVDPATGELSRRVIVEDTLRFTFQFAKIVDRYTLRIGLKESTGGIGVDARFGGFTLSADAFDAKFNVLPRLKLMAAYQFFKFLYVYAGVDDILNDFETRTVANHSVATGSKKYAFGRDAFGGVMLRFNDSDLAALLFIGGSALAGAAN